MIDLRKTVIPKSDQLNADDLLGQTRTIKVTKVSLLTEADQPIAIGYEDDGGKPYKPCKSMRRVLVNIWGPDGNAYIGRSMTLYRDDKVMFGGVNVGGIRISHMSHIDGPVTMALTVTRANRKPFTVQPLAVPAQARTPVQIASDLFEQGDEAAARGKAAFGKFWNGLGREQRIAVGGTPQRDLWLSTAKKAEEAPPPSDDLDDVFFDNSSPSLTPNHREEAAADASPAERRAGAPTSDLDGDPAPVPHEPAGTAPGPAEAASQEPLEGAAASSPPGAAAPSDHAQDKHHGQVNGNVNAATDDAIKTRRAEIRRDGDARAAAGTAALTDYLEGLRRAGEADLVSTVLRDSWREVAKAAEMPRKRK